MAMVAIAYHLVDPQPVKDHHRIGLRALAATRGAEAVDLVVWRSP